jgi:hypothetical protein
MRIAMRKQGEESTVRIEAVTAPFLRLAVIRVQNLTPVASIL